MMKPDEYTFRYFCDEVVRFREQFGLRTFWEKTQDERLGALSGIGFVFLNMRGTAEESEKAEVLYHSTMDEYAKRELLWICS
jgi:hypothetical protein